MSGRRNTGQIFYTHILLPMISRFGYLKVFSFLFFPKHCNISVIFGSSVEDKFWKSSLNFFYISLSAFNKFAVPSNEVSFSFENMIKLYWTVALLMGLCWKADYHDANSICVTKDSIFLIEFSVGNGYHHHHIFIFA
jgi:hypothetical protein